MPTSDQSDLARQKQVRRVRKSRPVAVKRGAVKQAAPPTRKTSPKSTPAEVKRGAVEQAAPPRFKSRPEAVRVRRESQRRRLKQDTKRDAGRTYGKTRAKARRNLRTQRAILQALEETRDVGRKLSSIKAPEGKNVLEDILEELPNIGQHNAATNRITVPKIGQHTYDPVGARLGRKPKKDKDTKVLGFNLEAELEGRGKLHDAGEFLKKQIKQNTGYRTGGGGGEYVEKIGKDVIDVLANAPASAYAVGAGLKEAGEGRPKRLKQLGKQVKEHDPIALALQGRFKEAGQEIEKHPDYRPLSRRRHEYAPRSH